MGQLAVTFPGISQPTRAYATNTLGVLPSVATVDFLPQATSPSLSGTLIFSDGIVSGSWTDARLDQNSLSITTNGHITSARIFDRRFWWKFTMVSGTYNKRRPDGSIENAKTPQELAQILLDAMGESGYDVSALPNEIYDRPFVEWRCSNPAYALSQLCRDRGCDVSLVHSTNTVEIVEIGTGTSIVLTDAQSVSYGYDYGEYPETIRVCADDSEFSAKFKLKAIGVDTDKSVKDIEDLSFKPVVDGWAKESPYDLIPNDTQENRELANKYVFRLFRIEEFSDETLNVPGGPTLDSIDEVRIHEELPTVTEEISSGRFFTSPALIQGVYFQFSNLQSLANTDPGTYYSGNFRVYPRTGYVLFEDPVYKIDSGEVAEPELYLNTGFKVFDGDTGASAKYTRDRTLAGGVGVYSIFRPELKLIVEANYDPADPTQLDPVTPTTDNESDLEDAADQIIDSILPRFQTNVSSQVKFRGIKNYQVDGLNRQVKWSIDLKRGANTWVSQNSESERGVLKSHEVDRIIRLRQEDQDGTSISSRLLFHRQLRGET